ncbi:DUF1292 domain-containing protein [Metabacillus idriensis]|uniref:DUF1292 domain-containing protein n=1 Tax=Metabacillus idriensis TaxID=324768 RepID=A0A6I2MDK0_9BACI|nr:DUF1292 domain-containing protein [Metabacillus idriensis]MCM3595742.1 DUF1292 domain-containing protein [Metabacillus idriensis]MRX53853.1 DUF1292 domain-containing protein [Metabacillus idriensis]OHR64575.1 cyclopropane-fatty-acyl-phospholipid synthase [Bacillus sp. HMSC76G11]
MDKIEVGEIFTISDENDQEQEVEVLGVLEVDGTEYVAVGFVEEIQQETDEDIDIYFLRVDEEGDFTAIESDDEFDKVSAAFDKLMEEEAEEN